jgi:hypothetical protein
MSCNCNDHELHRFEVSSVASDCEVAPPGGSPIIDNEIEITLASSGPDCALLQFTSSSSMLAPRPPQGSWICDQTPQPGQSGTFVSMMWQVPYQSGASQELVWELGSSSNPCTIKIIIKRV